MKKIYCILILISINSCKNKEEKNQSQNKTPTEIGAAIFEGKGNCVACHQIDQKIVGPSIQEIATIYKTKNGNIVDFLKNDANPLLDPSQYEVMKTNFAITKSMSDEELKAIEAYIYSN